MKMTAIATSTISHEQGGLGLPKRVFHRCTLKLVENSIRLVGVIFQSDADPSTLWEVA